MFVALLAWHCGLNYSSLTVLGIPSLSPHLFSAFVIYLFLFFHFSTEPSGLSVTGACRGPDAGGSWLSCGLGRPVGCSSALGM